MTSDDHQIRLEAARAWSVWEASTSKLFPSEEANKESAREAGIQVIKDFKISCQTLKVTMDFFIAISVN